jgi:hypothetical protein
MVGFDALNSIRGREIREISVGKKSVPEWQPYAIEALLHYKCIAEILCTIA